MVVRALEKAGIGNVEEVAGDFALKIGEGDSESTVFLSNIYANYCSVPRAKRVAVLAEFVSGAVAIPSLPVIPSDFAAAKPGLMPAIRDANYFSICQLMERRSGKYERKHDWVNRPLAGGLMVALAYDTEHNITSINLENFEKWGVSLDEAFAAAKENLWDRTDPGHFENLGGGVYCGRWGDSYDSSRLLLPEIIYRLAVDGDPIAFVPNRNELYVTGMRNTVGITAILKDGRQSHFERGHPLSPDLYVLENGDWKVFVPEDETMRSLWVAIKRQRDLIDYTQQQELLNEIHEKEGVDMFVAGYKLLERKDGVAYTICVWTSGIDSSLPQTEKIAFLMDPKGNDRCVVPWQAAVSVVGGLMEPEEGLQPVRYRVRQFPNAAQIAKLRGFAVEF